MIVYLEEDHKYTFKSTASAVFSNGFYYVYEDDKLRAIFNSLYVIAMVWEN